MMQIEFKGTTYEVATTLRVAYVLQSRFNHKPYMQIFQDIQNMKLEEQVRLLYTAFSIKNPDVCTESQFLEEILDNWNLTQISKKVADLIEGITFQGMSDEEIAEAKKAAAVQNQIQ